jgi:hypothetical protein
VRVRSVASVKAYRTLDEREPGEPGPRRSSHQKGNNCSQSVKTGRNIDLQRDRDPNVFMRKTLGPRRRDP